MRGHIRFQGPVGVGGGGASESDEEESSQTKIKVCMFVGREEYSLGIKMGLHPGVDASHQHPVVQVRSTRLVPVPVLDLSPDLCLNRDLPLSGVSWLIMAIDQLKPYEPCC